MAAAEAKSSRFECNDLSLESFYEALGELDDGDGLEVQDCSLKEPRGKSASAVPVRLTLAIFEYRVEVRFQPVPSDTTVRVGHVGAPTLRGHASPSSSSAAAAPASASPSVLYEGAFFQVLRLLLDLLSLPSLEHVKTKLLETFNYRAQRENRMRQQAWVEQAGAEAANAEVARFMEVTGFERLYSRRGTNAEKVLRAVKVAYACRFKLCYVCGRAVDATGAGVAAGGGAGAGAGAAAGGGGAASGASSPSIPCATTCGNDLCTFKECDSLYYIDLWSESHSPFWFPWDLIVQLADAALASNRREDLMAHIPVAYMRPLEALTPLGVAAAVPAPGAAGAGAGGFGVGAGAAAPAAPAAAGGSSGGATPVHALGPAPKVGPDYHMLHRDISFLRQYSRAAYISKCESNLDIREYFLRLALLQAQAPETLTQAAESALRDSDSPLTVPLSSLLAKVPGGDVYAAQDLDKLYMLAWWLLKSVPIKLAKVPVESLPSNISSQVPTGGAAGGASSASGAMYIHSYGGPMQALRVYSRLGHPAAICNAKVMQPFHMPSVANAGAGGAAGRTGSTADTRGAAPVRDMRALFHGSKNDCWLSILRNGLLTLSNTKHMTAGAAYGKGVYFAPAFSTSLGYSGGGHGGGFGVPHYAPGQPLAGAAAAAVPGVVQPPAVPPSLREVFNKMGEDQKTAVAEGRAVREVLQGTALQAWRSARVPEEQLVELCKAQVEYVKATRYGPAAMLARKAVQKTIPPTGSGTSLQYWAMAVAVVDGRPEAPTALHNGQDAAGAYPVNEYGSFCVTCWDDGRIMLTHLLVPLQE